MIILKGIKVSKNTHKYLRLGVIEIEPVNFHQIEFWKIIVQQEESSNSYGTRIVNQIYSTVMMRYQH